MQKVLHTLVVTTTTTQITHTSVVVVTTKVTTPINTLVVRTHAKTILVHCTSQHIVETYTSSKRAIELVDTIVLDRVRYAVAVTTVKAY